MKKLKNEVSEQILRSVHIEDGNIKIVNGKHTDGYMAELKIRAIGHFENAEEARHYLLREMTAVISDLFETDI